MSSHTDLRRSLVAAGARLGRRGLIVAAEGNLSVRTPAGILITPSGRRKDALEPADLILVDLEPGTETTGGTAVRPSSDLAIHRAIYAARPDVRAIVHAHLAAALALTAIGELPDPDLLPETAATIGRLPSVGPLPAGSDALAAAVAAALSEIGPDGARPTAVIVALHGAIAVGPDIVAAGDRIELVDLLCRVHRDVIALRAAQRSTI